MRRLIDADKVAKNVYDRIEKDLCRNTPPYNCDELEVCLPKEDYEYLRGLDEAQECAVKTIKKEPTVNAIPIEWIEEWGWKNGMSESMSLRVMIDDWEKENEERTNA